MTDKVIQIKQGQIPIITAEQAEQIKTDIGLVVEFEPKEREYVKGIDDINESITGQADPYFYGHTLSDEELGDYPGKTDDEPIKVFYAIPVPPKSKLLELRKKLGLASGRYGVIRSCYLVTEKHADNDTINPLFGRQHHRTQDFSIDSHFVLGSDIDIAADRVTELTDIQLYAAGFYNALRAVAFNEYLHLPDVKKGFFSSDQFRAIGENMDAVLEKIAKGNNPLIAKVITDVTDVKPNRQAMVIVYEALNHSLEDKV